MGDNSCRMLELRKQQHYGFYKLKKFLLDGVEETMDSITQVNCTSTIFIKIN